MQDEGRVSLINKGLGEDLNMIPMTAIDNEGIRPFKPL